MHALVLAALTEGSRGHQVAGCRVRFPRHLGQRMAPGVIKATVHPGEQLPKTQRYRRWIFGVEGERPAWTCDVGLRAANGTYAYNGGSGTPPRASCHPGESCARPPTVVSCPGMPAGACRAAEQVNAVVHLAAHGLRVRWRAGWCSRSWWPLPGAPSWPPSRGRGGPTAHIRVSSRSPTRPMYWSRRAAPGWAVITGRWPGCPASALLSRLPSWTRGHRRR